MVDHMGLAQEIRFFDVLADRLLDGLSELESEGIKDQLLMPEGIEAMRTAVCSLTLKQMGDVMDLLGKGMSFEDVARRRDVAISTVRGSFITAIRKLKRSESLKSILPSKKKKKKKTIDVNDEALPRCGNFCVITVDDDNGVVFSCNAILDYLVKRCRYWRPRSMDKLCFHCHNIPSRCFSKAAQNDILDRVKEHMSKRGKE